MCGLLDDLLPVFGSIAGFMVGGPWGAAIGGALGGFGGQYFQTHDFGQSLFGGAVGGIGGYFGGGNIAQGLGLQGDAATGLGDLAGTAAANGAGTLGGLEAASGGAAMFGPAAGTGTALGSAASALGGNGLGIAGGDALSGISSAGLGYMGGLGGSLGGTGLGQGTLAGEASNLNGLMAPTATAPTASATGPNAASLGSMSNTPTGGAIPGQTGALGGSTGAAPTAAPGGMGTPAAPAATTGGLEGTQAAPVDQNAMAAGAVTGPGPEAGTNLSTMYGPTSSSATVAPQGVMGQSIGQAGGNLGQTVQAGALGEAPKTGMDFSDLSSLFGGGAQQGGGMNPLMQLGKAGLGMYQQYQQQQAQNAYRDQINNMFSPNSPYAQQMAQSLARKDAAAGRNSQYGTRATELAAALTQAQAQALGGSNYYNAATARPGANMLNNLLYFPGAMQGLGQLGSAGFNGLQSLFSGF